MLVGLNEEVGDSRIVYRHTDAQSIASLLGVAYNERLQEGESNGSTTSAKSEDK